MNSRFIQTKQIKAIDRGPLKENHPESFVTQLWYKNDTIDNTLYDMTEGAHVQNFKIEYLDMPGVYHCLSSDFKDFFAQLSEAKSYTYFENKAIQTVIDFNYPLVKKRIIQLIVYPFIAFHLCFVFYTNVIYEGRKQNDGLAILDLLFSLILLAFSLYFFVYEMTQIMVQGMVYVYSIWNYIDLLAPIGVIMFWILQFTEKQGAELNVELNRTILALSTFFMWLKILYILRIFKETGYLIRAIVEVIFDMRIFLLILFLTAITFGDSFLKLSMGNEPGDSQFISNFPLAIMYGYRMILGDFDTSAFGDVAVPLAWTFFILCTILDMIVMLNLLIAIISDTYARVASNAEQASYQEMAKLIDENMYLVPRPVKETYSAQNQYILVVENLEKINYSNEDPVVQKIEQALSRVQTELAADNGKIHTNIKTLLNAIKEQADKIEAIKQDQEEIKKLVKTGPEEKKAIEAREIKNSSYTVSKLHKHMLLMQSVKSLKEYTNVSSFRCDGRHFVDCVQKVGGFSSDDENSVLYHCFICGFDMCKECYEKRSGAHNHEMNKVKFSEIMGLERYKNNDKKWKCNSTTFTGCKNGDKLFDKDDDVTYCCRSCDFDLCGKCIQEYKA